MPEGIEEAELQELDQGAQLASPERRRRAPHTRRPGYIEPSAHAGVGADFLRRIAAENSVMTRKTGKGSRNVMEML